jgi:hypothetical protein
VLGQLHLLDAQRRVDHVEDRRVAQLEERVLFQARGLPLGEVVLGGQILDRGLRVVAPGGDALDLRSGFRLVLLQLRQTQIRSGHLFLDLFDLVPRFRRGLRAVGQVVLVGIARRVEGRLQELGVLVRRVDLRVERLEIRVQFIESAPVRAHLVAGFDELPAQLVPLLAEGLRPRGLHGLEGLVPVQAQEGLLERLPVAFVIGDDHPDEDRGQERPRREEGAIQLRDVVVVIDRLGRRLARHGGEFSVISCQLSVFQSGWRPELKTEN